MPPQIAKVLTLNLSRKQSDPSFGSKHQYAQGALSSQFVATKHRGLLCAKQKRGDRCKLEFNVSYTFYLHLRGFVIVTGTILSASKSGLMFNIGISLSKRDRSNGLESATKFAGSILNLENFNERDLPEGMAFDFLVPGIKMSASLPALFVNLM